jgi:glutathione S-transferase
MLRLFHVPLSPFCRKVRLTLAEKRIEVELVEERYWEGSADFLRRNPAGKVPVLRHDGKMLAESQAICEYLDDLYPDPPLMPREPAGRYEVRRLCAWFDDKFHTEVTANLLYERVNKKLMGRGYPDSQKIKAGASAIKFHLDYLAWLLEHRRWLAGNAMTLADFTAAAHLSSSGLHLGCGLGPRADGQGLVCQDQIAARVPPASGRSGARVSRCAPLCRPGFLTLLARLRWAGQGGCLPPSALRASPPERIFGKMKGDGRRGAESGIESAGTGRRVFGDGHNPPRCHPRGGARLEAFLAGHHGQMGWMAERAEWRADPGALWPAARAMVMLAEAYTPDENPLTLLERRERGAISVYARGRDYHDVVKARLKRVGRWLIEAGAARSRFSSIPRR